MVQLGPEAERRPHVLLVARSMIQDNEGNILVIKRSKRDSYNPSLWEFPGGKIDPGQDVHHAIEREILEEAGIVIDSFSRIVYVQSEIIMEGKYSGLPYLVIVGMSNAVNKDVHLGAEHEAYKWVKPEEALRLELAPETRKALIVLRENSRDIGS